MAAYYLKLKDSKTEFFITGSSYNLRHLPPAEITIGSAKIKPCESIRNLGVMLNTTLSLSNHVNMLRRSINFHVRNLWRIRRYIDQNTCHHVARMPCLRSSHLKILPDSKCSKTAQPLSSLLLAEE